MAKFAQGKYKVKNPAKYVGSGMPIYRSSWELVFCQFCDNNENIVKWASEPIRLPYISPVTGKKTTYVPDFIVVYRDKNNTTKAELIEIKPRSQSVIEGKMNDGQRLVVANNHAKWAVATAWAKQNGLTFRVINEDQIFHQGVKKPRVAKPKIPKITRRK